MSKKDFSKQKQSRSKKGNKISKAKTKAKAPKKYRPKPNRREKSYNAIASNVEDFEVNWDALDSKEDTRVEALEFKSSHEHESKEFASIESQYTFENARPVEAPVIPVTRMIRPNMFMQLAQRVPEIRMEHKREEPLEIEGYGVREPRPYGTEVPDYNSNPGTVLYYREFIEPNVVKYDTLKKYNALKHCVGRMAARIDLDFPVRDGWTKVDGGWKRTDGLFSGWTINPHALSVMLNLKNSVFENAPHHGFNWYSVWCLDDSINRQPVHGNFRVWNYTGTVEASSPNGMFVRVTDMDTQFLGPAYDRDVLRSCTLDERVKHCCLAMVPRFACMPRYDEVASIGFVTTYYRRFFPYSPGVDVKIRQYLQSDEFARRMLEIAVAKSDQWKSRSLTMLKLRGSYMGVSPDEVEDTYQFWRKLNKVKDVAIFGACLVSVIGMPYALWRGLKSKHELRRDTINNIRWRKVPDQVPTMIKCSKLELEKFVIDQHRELPAINDDCFIRIKEPLSMDELDVKKEFVEVVGGLIKDIPAAPPKNCSSNAHAAVRIRQTFERKVDEDYADEFREFYKAENAKIPYLELDLSDEALRSYLQSHYSAKQAEKLFNMNRQMQLSKKAFDKNFFIKDEMYFKNHFDDKVKTRVIISYEDVVVAWFGFIGHQITKHLAKHFNHDSQFYYACKSNPDILGKVVEQVEKFPKKGDMDAVNFDGSLTKQTLEGEAHYVETRVSDFPGKELFLSCYCQHKYRSKRHGIVVKQKHGRMSGSVLTSCMNSLSSKNKFEFNKGNIGDFRAICLGDDFIFGCERMDVAAVERNYERLGMKMEVHIYDSAENIEFCSGWFPKVDGVRRYTNKPGKVMAKHGVNFGKLRDKRGYLYGIAKSLLPTLGHCPIAGELMRTIARLGQEAGIKPRTWRKQWNPYRPQGGVVLTPAPDTYSWFCAKYSTTLEEVLSIEHEISLLSFEDFQ
jgi:hypothetical protein